MTLMAALTTWFTAQHLPRCVIVPNVFIRRVISGVVGAGRYLGANMAEAALDDSWFLEPYQKAREGAQEGKVWSGRRAVVRHARKKLSRGSE